VLPFLSRLGSSGLSSLILGRAAASHLLHHFQQWDAPISSTVQLAAMLHHQQQPLSALTTPRQQRPAIKGTVATVAHLAWPSRLQLLWGYAAPDLCGSDSQTRKALKEQSELWEAAAASAEGRLALALLHIIMRSTCAQQAQRYQRPQLVFLAVYQAFWCTAAEVPSSTETACAACWTTDAAGCALHEVLLLAGAVGGTWQRPACEKVRELTRCSKMGLIGRCFEMLYDSTIDAEAWVSIRTSTAATNSSDAMLDAKSLTAL
jgi:hypothetical protein